jgi:phospholipid/cholesterol/gamma-HCH transport system permease protein
VAVQDVNAPAPESAAPEPAPKLGRFASATKATGEWTEFFGRTVIGTAGTLRYFSEILRQAAIMIRGTSVLVLVMNIFLGMSVANFGFFFLRSIGAGDFMGLLSGYVGPRQTGPTMFGYVFVAKICCGITAELGAMKIQQEVDALESTGVDAMRYVVGTRMAAVLIFTPIACAMALIGQIGGVYIDTVHILDGISASTLLSVNWSVQTLNDQLYSLITMFAIAITTTTTACFFGLRTVGGPAAVGQSVARGVFANLVILHVVSAFCAILFYGGDIKLPIGG